MIENVLPKDRPISFISVLDKVREIVTRVREEGDKAIIEYTVKFDKYQLLEIKASRQEIESQGSLLDENVKNAIDIIYDQLSEFHRSMLPPNSGGGRGGIDFGVIWKPIEKVGIYVPGGVKAYPSTLLMAGIPSKVAGVKEIYVSTPGEKVDPATAYISVKLGIKEIYKIGGAQAIAALAYGTRSVKKVDKIVGPGNIYVQAAKYLVSESVGIDGIEGPTELVIIADDSANPENIALDLLAQAEHGKTSFLVLISTSEALINKVKSALSSKEGSFYIIKVNNIDEAIKIANDIAPEHLSISTAAPLQILNKINNAGAITLGNTPPALIDYCAGPDHILPTNSWARFKGGITVFDFLKPLSYAISEKPEKDLIRAAMTLARYEGFNFHSKSIGARYE
jgi:histidinol dehydrogenase